MSDIHSALLLQSQIQKAETPTVGLRGGHDFAGFRQRTPPISERLNMRVRRAKALPKRKTAGFRIANFLENFIFAGVLALFLFPVLSESKPLLFPLGRDIVFRMIVEILLVAYISLIILRPSLRPPFSKVTIFFLSYLGIASIATIFAPQKVPSFWGLYFRSLGLFSLLHYGILLLIVTALITSWKKWNKLLVTALITVILTTIVAVMELIEGTTIFLRNTTRVMSTLNNPNFYGSYLLLIIFLTASFALIAKQRFWKLILGGSVVIQFLALVFTYSRGAYLGFAIGLFLFIAFLPLIPKNFRTGFILSSVLITASYSWFFFFGTQKISIPFLSETLVERFFDPATIRSTSGVSRSVAWQAGWQGMKARPILGYGPENFSIPFDTYYDGGRDHYGFLETWYDRAHNFILDIGNSVGFTGLIIYMGILASACAVLLRTRRAANTRDMKVITQGVFATLGAYIAQNLLNFDTTTSFLYFTLLLGFIVFLEHHADQSTTTGEKLPPLRESQRSNRQDPASSTNRTVVALILVALLIPALLFSFRNYHLNFLVANFHFNTAEEAYGQKQYPLAFAQYERGLQVNAPPVNPYLRHRFSTALMDYAMAVRRRQPDEAKKSLRMALVLLDQNHAREFPYFTKDYYYAGVISTLLFELGEKEYEALAHQNFAKAVELSPGHSGIYVEWAKVFFVAGDYEEGTKKINEALAINQKWGEPYWFLGLVQLRKNNEAEAKRYFESAQERGYNTKAEESLLQLISIYTRMKDYPKAISVYDELIGQKPESIDYYGGKAALYKQAGDVFNARKTALEILKINPSAKNNVEKFLNELDAPPN